MAEPVGARAATEDDLVRTVSFAELARQEVVDTRGGRWLLEHDLARVPLAEQHARAVGSDDQALVVGTIDGVVVGHGLARLSPARNDILCVIDELYVRPEARAIGVGSAVLAALRQWAVARDCAAIESQVLPGNRSAKNFFERVGMVTRRMIVSTDL